MEIIIRKLEEQQLDLKDVKESMKEQAKVNARLLKKVDKLLKKKDVSENNDQLLKEFDKKLEDIKADFTAKLEEERREHQMEKEQLKMELEEFKKEIKSTDEKKKQTEDTLNICTKCDSILPKDLREDGVSILCPKCTHANIIAPLKEGFKWISVDSPNYTSGWCQHYQQAPITTKVDDIVKCPICGTEEPCFDANSNCAIVKTPSEFLLSCASMKAVEISNQNMVETMNKMAAVATGKLESVFNRLSEMEKKTEKYTEIEQNAAVEEKSKPEERSHRCWVCKAVLSKELREDGVSAACYPCNRACIVGKLKDGFKWIAVSKPSDKSAWCLHFQQVSVDTPFGSTVKCQCCKTEGQCVGANRYVALMMTDAQAEEEKLKEKKENKEKRIQNTQEPGCNIM